MTERAKTIAYCHACGAPMDVSAVAPFTNVACPKCSKHTRVKREFGPYTLVRRHAVGGMSMVFAAHDNTLDREVALKILSEEYSSDQRRIDAFVEEARLTASFSHPNVVRVLTTGRAFERFYIAMEFVSGGHFEHQIRERGKIPEQEVLPLAIEVAQGLKAAHSAGLIHRDVKPGNILLDGEGHAKLVDFGLALVTKGGKATATEMWATPYYVPPETVEGHAEDFRSDLYAFGASIYHALAGKPPCDEESMATDVLREAKKRVKPLSQVESTVSVETCRIIEKAMAYDPKDRFDSYDEMIKRLTSSLRRIKAGKSESTGKASMRRALIKRKQRNVMIARLAAVVVAGGGILWWVTRKEPEAQKVLAKSGPCPVVVDPIPDNSVEIAKRYREARAAMEAKDFAKAGQAYVALHGDPTVQEPTRSWAGVEAVLAAYLDGRPEDGRKQAEAAMEHAATLEGGAKVMDPVVIAVLGKLSGLAPLQYPTTDAAPTDVAGVVASMLCGLKNWEQGLLGPAAGCFTLAKAAQLPPDDGWGAVYQSLAADYLADYEVLAGPMFQEAPEDAVACRELADNLNAVRVGLRTRGRAPFNVRAWQLDLTRRAKLLRESEAAAVEKPDVVSAPREGVASGLADVPGRLDAYAKAFDFAGAVEYLKGQAANPAGGAERSSLLSVAASAAVFLADLEDDLAREAVKEEFQLKSGETVVGIAMDPATRKIIATTEAGAALPCVWGDFSADALIRLHRIFVKSPASEIERLRRHECAIAFDWLAGDRRRALAAAKVLSADSPAFKRNWERIAGGLPD